MKISAIHVTFYPKFFFFRLEPLVHHSWVYCHWHWYNWNNVDCLHLLASVRVPGETMNTLFSANLKNVSHVGR